MRSHLHAVSGTFHGRSLIGFALLALALVTLVVIAWPRPPMAKRLVASPADNRVLLIPDDTVCVAQWAKTTAEVRQPDDFAFAPVTTPDGATIVMDAEICIAAQAELTD